MASPTANAVSAMAAQNIGAGKMDRVELVAQAAGIEAEAHPNVTAAVAAALALDPAPHLIIAGSLYLAGEVLALSPETWPT